MNNEQDYIKFWISIIEKLNEIEKDYNNLSAENKRRVDSMRDAVLSAHTYTDAINMIYSQITK